MTIGETLVQLRTEEGLTQQSLSIKTGLSERFINLIEHDKKSPSLRSLTRISDAVDKNLNITYSPGQKIIHIKLSLRHTTRSKTFEERVVELQHRLHIDCLKLCKGNKAKAEDLQQETTFRALVYHDRFNESCQLYTWLFSIAKNIHKGETQTDRYLTFVEEYIETADTISEVKGNVRLTKYIERLSDRAKQVYKMRLIGLSYAEIAEKLDITPLGAKSWFWTIRGQLKKIIETEITR